MKSVKIIIHIFLAALILAVIYIRTDVFIVIAKTVFKSPEFANNFSSATVKSEFYLDKENPDVLIRSYRIDVQSEKSARLLFENNRRFIHLISDLQLKKTKTAARRRIITVSGSGTYHHHTLNFIKYISEINPANRPQILFMIDAHSDSRRKPEGENSKTDCGNWINDLASDTTGYGISKVVFLGGYYRMTLEGDRWLNFKLVENGFMDVFTPPKRGKAYFKTSHRNTAEHLSYLASRVRSLKEDKIAGFFGHPGVWIKWKTLKDFIAESEKQKYPRAINKPLSYITIDLDVLNERYISTDWGNGNLTPEHLITLIETIKTATDVVGADICGWSGKEDENSFKTLKKVYEALNGFTNQ